MVFLLKKIVSSLLLPPTSLIIMAAVGLLLVRYRPRIGKTLAGASLFFLLAFSTPWVANVLVQSLQKFPPISDHQLAQCEAIVVLSGGNYRDAPEYGGDTIGYSSLERLRYALHLSQLSGLPILATGGAPKDGLAEAVAMRQSAEADFGQKIEWIEDRSVDTSSNARLSADLLKEHGVQCIVLVSHAWHLLRAKASFDATGLTVIPAPMGFAILRSDIWEFLPSAGALFDSGKALHEWIGILANQLRT